MPPALARIVSGDLSSHNGLATRIDDIYDSSLPNFLPNRFCLAPAVIKPAIMLLRLLAEREYI